MLLEKELFLASGTLPLGEGRRVLTMLCSILRHFTYKYYHASCFFKSVKDLPPLAQLQGFEELSAEDKLLAAQLCSAEAL